MKRITWLGALLGVVVGACDGGDSAGGGTPDPDARVVDLDSGPLPNGDMAVDTPDGRAPDGAAGCADQARRCAGETVEVCAAGQWQSLAACPEGTRCDDGQCVPDACGCDGRVCGVDGCGEPCGECAPGETCDADGRCQPDAPRCGDDRCDADETCADCAADCGACCGNGQCEAGRGEDCVACAEDCGCDEGEVCDAAARACRACVPQCDGRECGDDGCGGPCGACEAGVACENGRCVVPCVPRCEGRACGADGCGGDCGACDGEQVCDAQGRCVAPPDDCGDGACGAGEDCGTCDRDCGACCGDGRCEPGRGETCLACAADCACAAGLECDAAAMCVPACAPQCAGRDCGDDGCGGTCGACDAAEACVEGVCRAQCQPQCDGRACGGDGCGGQCGRCEGDALCDDGACVEPCRPACGGRVCGDDGCGGVCGQCAPDTFCNANGGCDPVCVPHCDGRVCGDDGCGGRCGECDAQCTADGRCLHEADCACPAAQVCFDGVCREPALLCSEENPLGLCAGGQLCVAAACVDQGAACSAGNPTGVCPPGQMCHNARCEDVDGERLCGDGLACTAERFDFARNRCVTEVVDGPCDDGNTCTNDRCVDGACVGTPIAGCVAPPGVDPVVSPTNVGQVTLTGSKPAASALIVNGAEAVPENPEQRWSVQVNLAPGENVFAISTMAGGRESGRVTVRIVYDTSAPRVTVNPAGGTYAAGVTVTVTTDEPATVQYTDDGATPDDWSPTFRSVRQFRIFEDTTLKFRARDVAGNVTDDIVTATFRISTAGSAWEAGPPLPAVISHAGAASIGGDLYVVGGTTGLAAQQTAWKLTEATGEWSALSLLPAPRAELAVVAVGNQIFAIGGQDDGIPLNLVSRLPAAGGAWDPRAPMPSTRFGLAAAVSGGRIYAFGGKTNGGVVLTNLEVYDPGNNTWTNQVAQMPRARYGHNAVEHNGRIWVVGGEDEQGTPIAEVDVYEVAQDRWVEGPALPTPRSFAMATRDTNVGAVTGGFTGIVVAGGRTAGGAASAVVEELVIEDGAWRTRRPLPAPWIAGAGVAAPRAGTPDERRTCGWLLGGTRAGAVTSSTACYTFDQDYARRLPPMPEGRFMHAAEALDGRIYLFGGRNFQETTLFWAFDPETGTYEELPALPSFQNGLASVAHDGRLYAIGGANQFGTAVPRMRAYDPVARAWSDLRPMPTARRDATAVVLGGLIYVIGGSNNGVLPTVEIYDPAADRWQNGPVLPAGRVGARAVQHDGDLLLVGGLDAGDGFAGDVLRFRDGQWSSAFPGFAGAFGTVFLAHDHQLNAFGGLLPGGAVGNRIVSYNLNTGRLARAIRNETNLFVGVNYTASASLYGRLYVFGGNRVVPTGPEGEALVQKIEARCFNGVLDGREVVGQNAPADSGGGCPGVTPLQDGDVRLHNGAGPGQQGRLEVYLGGTWGTVCDDAWGQGSTDVACGQLFGPGYTGSQSNGDVGGAGPIQMDDVQCNGNEVRIVDCRHTRNHNCSHIEDVLLTCRPR